MNSKNLRRGLIAGIISGVVLSAIIAYHALAAKGCSILKFNDIMNIGMPALLGGGFLGVMIGAITGNLRNIGQEIRDVKPSYIKPRLRNGSGDLSNWVMIPAIIAGIIALCFVIAGLGYGVGWIAWVLFC